YQTELDLATAPIPTARGAAVPLGALARVQTRERVTDAKARVDALPAITIAISPGGGANLISLSKALGVETQALSEEFNVSFRVLSDTGADVARSYAATGIAMLQGICAVALMTALLVSPARGGRGAPRRYAARAKLVAIASVPFMLTVAAAMLVALGFGLDRFALAGLAVGLGGTVDSAILAAERLGSSADAADGMEAMRSLTPALASGAATTLVVLVPLAALDFVSGGIATIAAAIASVCVVSFVLTLVVLPAFVLGTDVTDALYHGRSIIGRGLGWRVRQASRLAHRTLARGAMLCERKPLPVIMVAALLSVAGVLVIVCMPYDASRTEDNSITAARVEFEPGTSLSRVDASLAEYALAIGKEPGIKGTRTTAQRGSGTVYVSFDANMLREDDVPEMLRRLAVPGSFVWIPRATPGEQLWELVVSGDDDEICRAIAGEAARLASAVPGVKETLLNFKEGPENVVYHLDRARAAVLGTDMARASQSLRGALHGYVAYKRLSIDGETDVRVRALNPGEPTLDDAGTVLTGIEAGYTSISSLMTLERVRDVTRIHRQDRKRVAAITLRTDILDANTASKVIRAAVASLRLPPGYSIEFDRDAMETYERLGSVAGSFILALVMAYMAIAFLAESFTVPLVVLSVVPPSLAVPAIVLAATGTPFDAAFACAFVAVTGMVVNASVLTAEELRASKNASSRPGAHELYKAMRSRFGVVLATGGTSIAGALPFLFLTDSGGSIVRALSLVTAGGIAASIVAALTVVPA
ncbi:MAG: efflux RND transporter permease subunit, partial [Spirochaetales bacterium]|nr:efflux RND transporter permease subunit [Spirochaetales bacterium]